MAGQLTKRQRIVDAIEARLKLIKTTNTYDTPAGPQNYQTNAGNSVYVWRTGTFADEELAEGALVLRDLDEAKHRPEKDHPYQGNRFKRELHIQIELLGVGETAIDFVRQIIGDIEAAIRQDQRWNKLALGTRPRIDRAVVEQESRKVGGVLYEFFIDYVTEAFNSYE